MKTFKIAKKTNEVVLTSPINFETIVVSGNDLCLVVKTEQHSGINVGEKLHFEKFASGNSGELMRVCEEDAIVKNVVAENENTYVYFDYLYINPLNISYYNEITTTEEYKYKLVFTSPHNMLPTDVDDDYKVYITRGNNIISYGGIAFCYPNEIKEGKDIVVDETDCTAAQITLFNYETMEKNAILAKTVEVVSGKMFTPAFGDKVMFSTNAYFYTDETGTIVLFPPFDYSGGESVVVSRYTDFMNLGVTLEEDYDAKRMFQEYQVNDLFVKKIKKTIVPDFIDLEKIKYAPAFEGDDNSFLATGLTFNLHFRTRVPESSTRKYEFEKTWHFNEATSTWNGNGVDKPVKLDDLYTDADFVNSSNLIGFLGFTDEDIFNQKNRVKQSFLRLSFYDSNNPLTQSLLFYSTIFFNSGDLYGKYIKRKMWLEETQGEQYILTKPVVWSETGKTDACSALTCQFTVNDEYDMTKSGEGFNLYFFKQDAPFENEQQDIYMKVEFNHAGYGRTIPLIYWRKDAVGLPETLTVENYLENLYIPVRLSLSNNGYVYSFPDAVEVTENENTRKNGILWENDRIVLNLFEPMLTTDIIE